MGSLLAELIFDYMVHNCYFESAAVVARDLLDGAVEVSPQDRDEVRLRAGAAEALVAGRIDDAMSSAEHVAPGVLQAHPGILFRLQCQKFMELVSASPLVASKHPNNKRCVVGYLSPNFRLYLVQHFAVVELLLFWHRIGDFLVSLKLFIDWSQ